MTRHRRPRPAEPPVPDERRMTVRREITELLGRGAFTTRQISLELRVPEREVEDHLLHIRRTLGHGRARFEVTPSECEDCGFVFTKRERLSMPGRCPSCGGTRITGPAFSIRAIE